MSSPPPDISYLFPTDVHLTASVRDWATRVTELGHLVNCCGVVGAAYAKCKGGRKEHEFLIIRIRHVNEDHTSCDNYLVVERGPELRIEGQSSGTDDAVQGSKILSSQPVPAKDQVTISKDRTYHTIVERQGKHRILAEMHFENPTAFTIAQLAVLFQVVNRHAPDYHIIQHQCFWFAYSIWAIMAKAAKRTHRNSEWVKYRGVYQGKLVLPENDFSDIEAEFAVAWQNAQSQAQEQAAHQAAHNNRHREEGREQGKRERDADIERLMQERDAEVEQLKRERDAEVLRLERLLLERDAEVLRLERLLLERDAEIADLQASGRNVEFEKNGLSL